MHQNTTFEEKDSQKSLRKITIFEKLEPNKISVVSCNGSNYGYHFIIKEVVNLRDNLNVLGKTQKSTKLFLFQ